MAKRLKEKIACKDKDGSFYEVLLFQTVVTRRNVRGERVAKVTEETACLADGSAIVQTGENTFQVVWNGKDIKRTSISVNH